MFILINITLYVYFNHNITLYVYFNYNITLYVYFNRCLIRMPPDG
jgi:hypothetical protein